MNIIRYVDAGGQVKFAALARDGVGWEIEGDVFGEFSVSGRRAEVRKVLAPIVPRAVLCIGLNYRKHAVETGCELPQYPILFFKNPGAVQNPGDPIVLPTALKSTKVDYEVELVVVIGRTCREVGVEEALDYVLGYTVGNDVSARDWQKFGGGGQWCLAKSFDTFAPLGPCLVTREEIPDPGALALSTTLNGEVVQRSSTGDMIFSCAEIIAFLSQAMTLLPGTVIFTGTPEGVGMGRTPFVWLRAGDTVSVAVERIGVLSNPVVGGAV
ncbi:MAG: fumarylacetoacetate hydrolase family protein [Verrucomicrobiales bacterium]|jgi:2-keto-4-pentenoate hydratase/2-oxohepta-3-ene-1,7-dioic acid hydratase in catechol pathway|nr:fumarylacetoacetate hydrolase family protein [Verrucomicrobiales bacterium]